MDLQKVATYTTAAAVVGTGGVVGGQCKYGRLLGWLYINEEIVSLNEQMITEGYAHAYDGGTKDMNLEALREIRRSFGTLMEV